MNFFQKLKLFFISKAILKHRYENSGNPEDPISPIDAQRHFESLPNTPVPLNIAKALGTQKITFSNSDRDFDVSKLIHHEEAFDTWSIQLPINSKMGMPVKQVNKLDYIEVAKLFGGKDAPNAHLPEWSKSLNIKPLVVRPRIEPLTSFDGSIVKPMAGVFGADNREEVFPNSYPDYLVGRLDVYVNGDWVWNGSAALVGPRHIATAGHLVPWAADDWGAIFTPAYYDGESVLGAGANSWVTDVTGWNTNDHPAAHDMAVMRLETDLGNWLGYFGARTFKAKWLYSPFFWLNGYPGDLSNGERQYYQTPIQFVGMDSENEAIEIQHVGDIAPGQSGGPLWAQWKDGPCMVGTLSGGKEWHGSFLGLFDYNYNLAAGGNSLLNLIHWARANWP